MVTLGKDRGSGEWENERRKFKKLSNGRREGREK